ncbi:MAG: hypothetical protein AAGU04_07100 [Anaerolineaceae bacterium]
MPKVHFVSLRAYGQTAAPSSGKTRSFTAFRMTTFKVFDLQVSSLFETIGQVISLVLAVG